MSGLLANIGSQLASALHFVFSWIFLFVEYLLLACGIHPDHRLLNRISLRRVGTRDPEEAERARLLACAYQGVAAASGALIEAAACCSVGALDSAIDDHGYTLLQQALAKEDVSFARRLVQAGCSTNVGSCSRPLHLAAQTGNPELVRLLLRAGARIGDRCGMCYPQPHVDGYASYSKFFFINRQPPCARHERDAVQVAIDADHAEVLREFNDHDPRCLRRKFYLHHACESGARECVAFLAAQVSLRPGGLAERDCQGYTPLGRCLHGAGDASLARHLADLGADVLAGASSMPATAASCSPENGGAGRSRRGGGPTALHVLFELDSAAVDLVAKTQLVLGLGGEACASVRDEQGNAPLHGAACMFADRVRRWSAKQPSCSSSSRGQSASDAADDASVALDALAAVRLLLRHNADPTAVDSEQQLPLLRILAEARECLPAAAAAAGGEAPADNGDAYRLLDGTCATAGQFVANRFPANTSLTDEGVTAVCLVVDLLLAWWLRSLSSGDGAGGESRGNQPSPASDMAAATAAVLASRTHLEALTLRGASLNVRFKGGRGIVSLLAAHAKRVLTTDDDQYRDRSAAFLDGFMAALFELGLDPNGGGGDCASEEESRHVNALAAFVGLLQEPAVKRSSRSSSSVAVPLSSWLRTILIWGGNPDLEPYRAEPVICTSQANIFLKAAASHPVKHVVQEMCDGPWLDREDAATAVGTMIRLLASCMSHEPLTKALDSSSGGGSSSSSVRSLLARRGGKESIQPQALGLEAVRSLKELARVAVMVAIDRRPAQHVDKLPLPPRLKRYVLLQEH